MMMDELFVVRLQRYLKHSKPLVLEDDFVALGAATTAPMLDLRLMDPNPHGYRRRSKRLYYSITRPALASNDGEIVMPRALAGNCNYRRYGSLGLLTIRPLSAAEGRTQ
jgi:hypothetical protein